MDSFTVEGHVAKHRVWLASQLEVFIKHNYLEIAERRCLNYLPGHEPALPAASLPVISASTDISLPTPAKVGGEGVPPAPLSGGTDQSSPNSTNPQSVTVCIADPVAINGVLEQSKAVSGEVVGDSYPGTLSEMKAVLVAEEWPREAKVRVYGVCGNMRLMVGELEDGRRVSFWKGVRNWRINDWVPMRLDRGGGTPVYLPV